MSDTESDYDSAKYSRSNSDDHINDIDLEDLSNDKISGSDDYDSDEDGDDCSESESEASEV